MLVVVVDSVWKPTVPSQVSGCRPTLPTMLSYVSSLMAASVQF